MSDEILRKNEENGESEAEESNLQPTRSLGLDLGDDCVYNIERNRLGTQEASVEAGSQLQEPSTSNPFSFKHFLKENLGTSKNYQSLGARPKVYRERSRHVTPPESPQRPSHSARKFGEFSSALPDFVQDHLVIEQCFLGNKTNTNPAFNLDLPDFAQGDQSRPMNGPTVSRSNSIDDPVGVIPLDLPGLSIGNAFPLDLPLSANVPPCEPRTTPLAEVGNSKSLPDFLTDGPVRTNADGAATSPCPSAMGDISRDLSKCHRCAELSAELANARQQFTCTENESERNLRRAAAAESTVAKLKQELKTLKAQLRQLQSENQALREGEIGAAAAGASAPIDFQVQRLAQELRGAASTAEHSLRSLLTGVDNLRIMASTLENINRIEEKLPSNDRFSRFDSDSAGPAL